MAPRPQDFPLGKPRILGVVSAETGHFIVGVLVDPHRKKVASPFGTTLVDCNIVSASSDLTLIPHGDGEAVDISGYVLVDIKPDEQGQQQVWIFEKLPGPVLEGEVVTPEGQVATVYKQRVYVDTGVPVPDALTVSSQLQPENVLVGVLEKVTVPEVFPETTKSKQIPDLIPDEFKGVVPTVEESEVVVGEVPAGDVTLSTGEIAKREQQLTKFKKRVSKTKRASVTLPVSVVEKQLSNEGQVVTVTKTLNTEAATTDPVGDATTVDASVKKLGDGNAIKTVATVPEVFDKFAKSVSKPVVIPERFRASSPTVEISRVTEGTSIPEITLSADEVEKQESRLTEFVKRVVTKIQDLSDVQSKTLYGQDYDASLDVGIPFIETIVNASPGSTSGKVDLIPLSDTLQLKKELDISALKNALKNKTFQVEVQVNINLPSVLLDAQMIWEKSHSLGGGGGQDRTMIGPGGWVTERIDTASVSVSIAPKFFHNIREGYRGPATATEYIRYVEDPNSVDYSVFGAEWPIIHEEGGTIVLTGERKSATKRVKTVSSVAIYWGGGSTPYSATEVLEDNSSIDKSYFFANLPPCLHGLLSFSADSDTKSSNYGGADVSLTVNGTVLGSIPATAQTSFPAGTYIISKNITPYQFGLWKISVVAVDVTPYV